jgi:hypothetical protein
MRGICLAGRGFRTGSLREETLAPGIFIPLRAIVNTPLLPIPLTLPFAICPTLFYLSALERYSISLIDRDHGAIATTPSIGLYHSLVVLYLFHFCESVAIAIYMSPILMKT